MPGVGATYENVVNAEHVYEDLTDSDLSAGWREVGVAVPDKARSVPPPVKRTQVTSFRVFQPVIGPATAKDRKRYQQYALTAIPLDEGWKPKVEATLRKESVKPWQVACKNRGVLELKNFLYQQAHEESPQNAVLPLAVEPDQLSGFGEAVFEWMSVVTFIKGAEDPDKDLHWPLPVYVPKEDIWASTAEIESMFRTFSSDPAAMEKARKGNAAAMDAKFMMPPWSPATGAVVGPDGTFTYEACTDLVIKPNHDVNYKIKGGPILAATDWCFHPDKMMGFTGDIRKKRIKRGREPVEIMLTAMCDGARDVWGILGPRLIIRGTRCQVVEFSKFFCDEDLGFPRWWGRLPSQTRQAFLSRPKWYGLPSELDPHFRDLIHAAEETVKPGDEFVLGRLNEEKLISCTPAATNWFKLEDMIKKKYGEATFSTVGGEQGMTGRTTLFFHAAMQDLKFGTPFVSTIISARKLNAAMDFEPWKDRALWLKKLEKERLVLNPEERKLVHQAHLSHISDYHRKLFADERSTHIYTPRSVDGTVTGPGNQPRASIPPHVRIALDSNYTRGVPIALDSSGLRHSIGADGLPGPSTLPASRARPPPLDIRTASCWTAAVRRENRAQKNARAEDMLEAEDTVNNQRRVEEGLSSLDPDARLPSRIPHDTATDAFARQGALAQEDHPLRPMGARRAQEVLAENRVAGISPIQESDEPPDSPPTPLIEQRPLPTLLTARADPPPDQVPEQQAVADVCRLVC